jgi:hypothetical protein
MVLLREWFDPPEMDGKWERRWALVIKQHSAFRGRQKRVHRREVEENVHRDGNNPSQRTS